MFLSQEYFLYLFPHLLSRLRCWFLAEASAPLVPEMTPCWAYQPSLSLYALTICGRERWGSRYPVTACRGPVSLLGRGSNASSALQSPKQKNSFLSRLLTDPAAASCLWSSWLEWSLGRTSQASLRFAHRNARQVFISEWQLSREEPRLCQAWQLLSWGFMSGLLFCAIYNCPGIKIAVEFSVVAP